MRNRPARALGLREGDREELVGGAWCSRLDGVANRGWDVEEGDRAADGVSADGDRMAGAGSYRCSPSVVRVGGGRSTMPGSRLRR